MFTLSHELLHGHDAKIICYMSVGVNDIDEIEILIAPTRRTNQPKNCEIKPTIYVGCSSLSTIHSDLIDKVWSC